MANLTSEEKQRRAEHMKKVNAARREKKAESLAEAVSAQPEESKAVRTEADRKTRQRRGVFNGTNLKLEVNGEIPGHKLRWWNDYPGRIAKAQETGWEFVTRQEVELPVSTKALDPNTDLGEKVRLVVGQGEKSEPLYAYLMKIKEEWFEEDQAEMQDAITSRERAMIRSNGSNADRIENTYVPGALPGRSKPALSIRHSLEKSAS